MAAATAVSPPIVNVDAHPPRDITEKVLKAGVAKAGLNLGSMFALAMLAGVFIGLGAEFCTLVITGSSLGFGLTKLIGGLVFSLGLILVVVSGAELFTGNNLMTVAWLNGAITWQRVLRNWTVVFLGNFAGSVLLAAVMFLTRQWAGAEYTVGATALRIAADKAALPLSAALARGVLCNLLVCLAVWQCFAGRSVTDKVLAIVFPITAFVASGFEHSVANMYFIPYGMMLKGNAAVVTAAGLDAAQLSNLTFGGLFANLIPVTIGNLVGGAVVVGAVYWYVYMRHEPKPAPAAAAIPAFPTVTAIPRPLALLPEGKVVKNQSDHQPAPVTLLGSFTIASADMYYSEVAQRDIYMRDDPETGFHIWGEVAGGVSEADLGEVLLEYAMSAVAVGDLPQAFRRIDGFGRKLGESLAIHIMQSTPAENTVSRAACALECVLESLGVEFVVEHDGDDLSYTLAHCPLCDTSDRSGLSHVEVAHHGLNALCHSLIHSLDPDLRVKLPRKPSMDTIFTMTLNPVHTVGG
jgi:formate/nitrite transporter